jgi:hypothetical protein
MARQHRGRVILPVAILVLALTCPGRAQDKPISEKDLTCKVFGGSFVLDDTDFVALTQEKLGTYKVSREKFVTFKPDSAVHIAICDSRKLWRLVRDKKVTIDDFVDRYKWMPNYFNEAELKKVVDAQIDVAAKNWR